MNTDLRFWSNFECNRKRKSFNCISHCCRTSVCNNLGDWPRNQSCRSIAEKWHYRQRYWDKLHSNHLSVRSHCHKSHNFQMHQVQNQFCTGTIVHFHCILHSLHKQKRIFGLGSTTKNQQDIADKFRLCWKIQNCTCMLLWRGYCLLDI